MKKFFVSLLLSCVLCGTVSVCCGCSRKPQQAKKTDTAMGTVIQQNIYATEHAESTAEEIMELLRGLEEQLLSARLETSELFRVNASAGDADGVLVSEELSALLDSCLAIRECSDGALDVTIGSVVRLWDIDGFASGEQEAAFRLPEETALQEALEQSGSDRLIKKERMLFLPEGMQLDMGAVGKGVALDRILELLQGKDNIAGAIISVGGSILTYGEKPDGSCWRVGITDPADTGSNVGVLELTGQWCVSTSGDYERYVELDGVRYHHILDPGTGYPADSGVAGVTVLCREGVLSDALSTACFILGTEKGKTLAESYGAEALFVGKDGRIDMTEGMRQYFSEQ